jgi:protein involved in polysaccharide export with SLBB domain
MPCRGVGRQAPESYRVGSEDVVNVAVARHPEFSGEFYVPPDGVITLPAAGPIPTQG